MKRVYLASPLRGNVEVNQDYARRCMLDSLRRGEAPFVPHLLYPQVLALEGEDDELGIRLALLWLQNCEMLAVYLDNGLSDGMKSEIKEAQSLGLIVEFRTFNPILVKAIE